MWLFNGQSLYIRHGDTCLYAHIKEFIYDRNIPGMN